RALLERARLVIVSCPATAMEARSGGSAVARTAGSGGSVQCRLRRPNEPSGETMTVVCIAGMHRSGTSMVARLLNLCGLYLGEDEDLMPSAADNPEGFWENLHFVDLNEKILSALQGGWDMPP